MKKLHLFSMMLAVSAAMFACKDKTEDPPPNNNNNTKPAKELLTQKNWKISTLMSGTMDIWSNPAFVAACNKDNEYKFRSDDSLTQYDKSQKCNGSDPDSTVSSYKLYNNNTQVILNLKLTSSIILNDTAEIMELTETSLKINAEYSSLPATITFIHP
jgi:hypothetical protein